LIFVELRYGFASVALTKLVTPRATSFELLRSCSIASNLRTSATLLVGNQQRVSVTETVTTLTKPDDVEPVRWFVASMVMRIKLLRLDVATAVTARRWLDYVAVGHRTSKRTAGQLLS
jgi:hypothetical protein